MVQAAAEKDRAAAEKDRDHLRERVAALEEVPLRHILIRCGTATGTQRFAGSCTLLEHSHIDNVTDTGNDT